MSPSRPYLLCALYDWILENNCTPYIVVNAGYEGTIVPQEYVQGGQIILNINPSAVHKFGMGKEAVQFTARFSGVSRDLYIPIPAIKAIYAKETGGGMVFPEDEYDQENARPSAGGVRLASVPIEEGSSTDTGSNTGAGAQGPGSTPSGPSGKKPHLRIVK